MIRIKKRYRLARFEFYNYAHDQKGFGYLGALMVMALAGIAMQQVAITWQIQRQREQEIELLFIGHQYQQAIKSYFESTPSGNKSYPNDLQDLLLDKRFPTTKRHLRQLYRDPMQPSKPWGLIKRDNLIIGVYSTSTQKTVKKHGFIESDEGFENANSYQEWKFVSK